MLNCYTDSRGWLFFSPGSFLSCSVLFGFLCSCLIFLLQRVTPSHSTLIPSGTSSNGQADTAVNGQADKAVNAPQLNHLSIARPPLVFAGDSATFRE